MDTVTRQSILRDLMTNRWFGSALEVYSLEQLQHAGLRAPLKGRARSSREHPVTSGDPYINFLKSPKIDEIRKHARGGRAVVLIAMGSYAPMHVGHIEMMEAADRAVRAEGDIPAAAVFSLHCEDHVRAKILPLHPNAPVNTTSRIEAAEAILPDELSSGTPIFLDRWDASIAGGPRSFTDIMWRVSRTLDSFEIRGVTPVAVFGSDNASSMRAFARWGRGVCVMRPRHEEPAREFAAESQMTEAIRSRRVLLAQRPDGSTALSSTDIRKSAKGPHL